MNINLWYGRNNEPTIHRSKAVGEPPFQGGTAQAILGRILTADPSPPSAVPAFLPPLAPGQVTAEVIYGDIIRLYFTEPERTGGQPVTGYLVEYDVVRDFNSAPNEQPLSAVTVPAHCLKLSLWYVQK